ncbi:MAG: NusA antitermination factor, partial [Candidatus Levybacteria bacterium GW2011_GWA1_39_32]
IAVFSNQSGIDPVGSCVGQKGVRVQAIIAEFNGIEKIDIIQWSDNSKDYIVQALSPAKNLRVELNEKEKSAHVFVPLDELSLAIGKEGQNVRLASKLTGYNLEIEEDKTVAPKKEPKEKAKEEKEQKTEKIKVETAEDKVETSEDKVEASSVETASETVETVETEENKNEGS